ncbi:4-hydroxybenzoate 3-monooxygenase [Nocardioides acrostichi]|uniref:4-hydroxybenzoate 3-monooxygenase n=1 Tax=Nocardioides acrostichi TaxID=2784339 RepID=A0A930UX68_9ACTN|nr:4-hydroxybenzoate 3-monooxygenase [Nocardioides acrostichi]MBF4161337.1 4-hydroxybenzoate 3-monooxygenase [Nocardioides acrostichi]
MPAQPAHSLSVPVVIVGGGPAGLLLSHLLASEGVESLVLESRSRARIEATHRAGILEQGSVRLLAETGVSDRVHRDGHEHRGINLRVGGVSHRIDFQRLAGASTWLYPQTEVFVDLADARERDGGEVLFEVTDTEVDGLATPTPRVRFTQGGEAREVTCEVVVGADGSRSMCRDLVPKGERRRFGRTYPFAWFGILAEAPMSSQELIYTHSERGFALISSRTETLQRMYFQCDPNANPDTWADEAIWAELQARVSGHDGLELAEGPIVERSVLPFRSFVQEPMRHGRLVLAGDAAHTVPPTGAKGLNLALRDVEILAQELPRALRQGGAMPALDDYSARALARVWKAQHFSYWMTTMLHRPDGDPEQVDFDVRRSIGEIETLVDSEAGRRYLAEGYTGWPTTP